MPPKPPPENMPEPEPDEEDGEANWMVWLKSAKLELSCAPISPTFALNDPAAAACAASEITPPPAKAGDSHRYGRYSQYISDVPA